MSPAASNLQIDSARLWDTIHETAKFGATPKGGVRRLTLSAEDKHVRDWFRKACEAAGLTVEVDALGSMFALRKGRDMSKPPVGLGSHLDTQPTGGKYDGVLGTLAALEVVRTLNDAGIETEAPICIVNWTNEEGSRFAPAMMASAAYVGDFTTDDILSRKDAEGVTVAEALDRIGYRGNKPVGFQKLGCFVELHIEQGPILEAEGKTIGVDPAWLSKPEILPSYQSTPWPESTTPMVLPSASRIGPCSMCNSTKQPSFWKPTGLSPR